MPRTVLLALALLSACTGGCAVERPVLPVAKHQPGQPTKTNTIRYPGQYALFHVDDPDCTGVPVAVRTLRNGDAVGFERDPDGTLVAIAPGERQRLPEAEYAWRLAPDSPLRWRERLGEKTEAAIQTTKTILLWAVLITVVVGILAWYVLAHSNAGF